MKNVLLCIFFFFLCGNLLQAQSFEEEVLHFQQELNKEYKDPEQSPLSKKERRKFKRHNFFPIDKTFRVEAKLVRTEDAETIQMETSTDRLSSYKKYGDAIFEINGKTYSLSLYQNLSLMKQEKYRNYLFLPFTDLSTGEETYGGGRYIDLEIPEEGDVIIIDFNQAYHPFCAYSYRYSCPIPPKENFLNIKITAGIRNKK